MSHTFQPSIRGIVLFFAVLPGWIAAAPVSRQTADRAAAGWLRRHPSPLEARFADSVLVTEAVVDRDEQTLYYVVHLQPQGFVILSADDEIEPVIAFSASGYYDGDADNPLTTMLTKDLTGRLEAHRRKDIDHNTVRRKTQKWQLLLNAEPQTKTDEFEMGAASVGSVSEVWVDPVVQSKWDQGSVGGSTCYNYYTPGNYPAGCVATAMAQVMRYHQWPQTGIGVNGFQIYVNGSPQWANTRGGNDAGGAYNWAQMPYDPQSGVTATQRQAIGALCFDAGVSVGMSYWSSGSSATLYNASQRLTGTFLYSNSVYTQSVGDSHLWNSLNANLDAQLPVILGISRTGGGHAVVADGYGYHDGTLYHHINMGWGGADNTWYNLPLIDAYWTYNVIDDCAYNMFTSGTGEIVSGRITNLAGAPLQGVVVKAYIGGSLHKQTVTNARGVYALKHLSSNTTYRISAEKTGESFPDQYVTTGRSNNWSVPGNRSGILFASASAGPPTAFDIDVNVDSTETALIQLLALDDGLPDPNLLHYIITSLPSHGTLSEPNVGPVDAVPYIIMAADANGVNYTPCPYFGGQDTFTYKANDGGTPPVGGDSNIATVTLNVNDQLFAGYGTESNTYSFGIMMDTDFFYSARSQVIYLSSEIGTPKRLTGMSIRIGAIPGRTLSNWTLRMQHTNKTYFDSVPTEFLTSGWTTVYQGNLTITQTGWIDFGFSTPFEYNGTQNLMVDFSFNNTATTSPYGGYFIHNAGANRVYSAGSHTGTHGNPLLWGDYYGKYYSVNASVPSLKLTGVPAVEPLTGDFDASCTVRLPDLAILAAAYGSQAGDANYNPACDISAPKDNTIDLLDLLVFAEHWLQAYAP